jgi:Tfp pilus assembly protein PilF
LIYQVVRSPISASGADEALGPAAGRKIPFAGFLGEQTFGPEHYEVASNLHNLAAVLCTRGDPDQAERLYLRALTIKENLLGTRSPDAALTRNNLGALLNLKGRPREAAVMLQSAVEILQDRLAPDHPHVAFARANLESALLSLRGLDAEDPKCCLNHG